jgi:hypothetical protein
MGYDEQAGFSISNPWRHFLRESRALAYKPREVAAMTSVSVREKRRFIGLALLLGTLIAAGTPTGCSGRASDDDDGSDRTSGKGSTGSSNEDGSTVGTSATSGATTDAASSGSGEPPVPAMCEAMADMWIECGWGDDWEYIAELCAQAVAEDHPCVPNYQCQASLQQCSDVEDCPDC